MDNRHGLIAGEQVTTADGTAEVDAALQFVDELVGTERIPLGADKGYNRHKFVQDLSDRNVTPHVGRKCKGSAVDGRTTRHAGYSISIRARKRIESIFGWMKTVGGMRKARFCGLDRVGLHFTLVSTACDLGSYGTAGGSVMGVLRSEFGKLGVIRSQRQEKTLIWDVRPRFLINPAIKTVLSQTFSAAC